MTPADLPDDYYERLGVPRNATPQQLKKAYREKAAAAHPDHGGSDEQFIALTEAYEILYDQDSRQKYDRGEHDCTHKGPSAAASDESSAVPVAPYVSPDKIVWRVGAAGHLAPVTVRLSNRYGVAIGGECYPESWSGPHWVITGGDEVLEGDALYDFTVAPNEIDNLAAGTYTEELRFVVADKLAAVRITIVVTSRPAPRPAGTEAPPPSSSGPSRPLGETHVVRPARRSRRRLTMAAIILLLAGIAIALSEPSTPSPKRSPTTQTVTKPRPTTAASRTSAGSSTSTPASPSTTSRSLEANSRGSRPSATARRNTQPRPSSSAQPQSPAPSSPHSSTRATRTATPATPPAEANPGHSSEVAPPQKASVEAGGGAPATAGSGAPAEATGGASHENASEPPASAGN